MSKRDQTPLTNGESGNEKHHINFQNIDVDRIWNHIGRFGKYQVVQMILITIAALAYSPSVLANVFVGE
jgi:hypothetical protein